MERKWIIWLSDDGFRFLWAPDAGSARSQAMLMGWELVRIEVWHTFPKVRAA